MPARRAVRAPGRERAGAASRRIIPPCNRPSTAERAPARPGGHSSTRPPGRAPGSRAFAAAAARGVARRHGDLARARRHRRLGLLVDQEPLHRAPGVARDAEQHFGRGHPAVQVVVHGREAETEVVGEGLGLVGHDFSELPREGRDADRAHVRSPLGSLRPKKSHRTLRGRWPFFRLEGFTVYAGSSPPAVERPPAQIGVRFVACAPRPVPHTASLATVRWLMTNSRLDAVRTISAFLRLASIYTGAARRCKGGRFHSRPGSLVTQSDERALTASGGPKPRPTT